MKEVIVNNTTKRELHHLIEILPAIEINNVKTFIEYILIKSKSKEKRIMQVLKNSPLDDEPLTDREKKTIKEAEKDIEQGNYEPLSKVKKDFAL